MFIILIANSGGLSTGGVVIPISLAFFQLDTRESIALSNVSVFFCNLVRFVVIILRKKHPLRDHGVEVDYNIATLMIPSIIIGANIGVIFNLLLPQIVIGACLTLIFLILFIRSCKHASKLHREEEEQQRADIELAIPVIQRQKILLTNHNGSNGLNKHVILNHVRTPASNKKRSPQLQGTNGSETAFAVADDMQAIINRESTHLQWSKVLLNWTMLIVLVVVTMLRKFWANRCTGRDWFCLLVLVIAGVVNTLLGVRTIRKETEEKMMAGYGLMDGDFECKRSNVLKCISIAFGCGLLHGTIGVSPGLLLNPMIILLGVHTVVGVSTVVYVVLFATMATSFIAVVEDLLNP
jgi:uncharacterized membrane protein YfcA